MPKTTTRICTSVFADSPQELARKVAVAFSLGLDLVELRIDKLRSSSEASPGELSTQFAGYAERPIVITVRSGQEGGGFSGGETERLEMISRLAELRPAYLDIELATARANKGWVDSLPQDVERIVSWHDFKGTPALEELRSTCREALEYGSIAKVVTTATQVEDNLTTLALCGDTPGKVVSFCMGDMGSISRVVSMTIGAPFTYASIPNEAVAAGQLSVSTMKKLRSMIAE